MRLPVSEALSILFVLFDEWLARHRMLALLGAEDDDLDARDALDMLGDGEKEPESAHRERVHGFVAETGGEVTYA